ncbi:MAG: O-antigen ligase family protein, partial [Blastocatellia bacterium]
LRQGLARLLDRLIFASLLALFALFAIPYGVVEPWWESIFECAVFALTALWIIEGLLSGTWRVSGYRLLAPLLALIILAFLQSQSSVSADPYETRRFAFKLLALTLTGVLLRSHIFSRRRLGALVHMMILVGVASAVFGIVRQTAQHDAAQATNAEGFLLHYLRPGEGYAQFINRNHFAFLMEMALGLALGLVAGAGARRDRALIYVAAMIPLLTGLALSNSRGGVGSLLGQAILAALMFGYLRRARRSEESGDWAPTLSARFERLVRAPIARFSLAVCLVLALAIGVIWMGGDPLVNRLEALPADMRAARADERASQSRLEIWRATWGLITAHPIAGIGLGAYAAAISSSHDGSGELVPQEAHNDYLELLASGGVIGGLLGLWFVLALIKSAREQLRLTDPFRRAACLGAILGLFGVAIHSLVDFGLHITINALVCAALVVIATLDGRVFYQYRER